MSNAAPESDPLIRLGLIGGLAGAALSSLVALMVLAQAPAGVSWILPPSDLTPGDVLTTDAKKICRPGYGRHIRPVPVSVEQRVFAAYQVRWDRDAFKLDHLIPLSLGGSNSVRNLWVQSRTIPVGARQKEQLETWLRAEVCAGRMTLTEAQATIRTDWYRSWRRCCRPPEEQDQPAAQPQGTIP